MKIQKITIINETNKLTDYEMTYIVNKLYERGMIDYKEKIQEFKINQNDFVIVENKDNKEVKFTLTNKKKKIVNDLLNLM